MYEWRGGFHDAAINTAMLQPYLWFILARGREVVDVTLALAGCTHNCTGSSEQYTTAWVSKYVEGKYNVKVPVDSYRSGVKLIDKTRTVFPGEKEAEVELDTYGTQPVHAVAEYKSILSTENGRFTVDEVLQKVIRFVRKVRFLEHHQGNRPLAFFCVSEIDRELVGVVEETLLEVGGQLVYVGEG
jgi:hypothetical protein